MASYVKRVNIRVEAWAQADGNYRFQASNYIEADKPWFAPGGVFRSQAERAQRDQFLRIRNRTIPEMARVL
jgi:hypothetical protein